MTQLINGVVFDIDGTLLRGGQILPGVQDVLTGLRKRRLPLALFTNDNRGTITQWVARLADLGLEVAPSEILTSAVVAAYTTAQLYPKARILPLGDVGLMEALQKQNLHLLDLAKADQAEVVVMGKDPHFNQDRLNLVCQAIWRGATFIATNYDGKMPVADGFIPGTGAMVKAVAYATGVEPLVTGKPSKWAGRLMLDRLSIPGPELVMVGDQLNTDIKMGNEAGMTTVLVLTGATKPDVISGAASPPDVVLSDLTTFLEWLDTNQQSN